MGSRALAAEARIDPQTFHPNLDGKGLGVIESFQTMEAGEVGVGFYLNYAKRPLPMGLGLSSGNGGIDDLLAADLAGVYGIRSNLSVGLRIPLILRQVIGAERRSGIGDIGIAAKAGLLTEQGGPFSLAFVAGLYFPTGKPAFLMGDGRWKGELTAAIERNFGRVLVVGNLGYRLANKKLNYQGVEFRDQVLYGLGAGFNESSRLYYVEVFGSTPADDAFSGPASPLELAIGIKQSFLRHFAVEGGGGRGLTQAFGSPRWRLFLGLRYASGKQE